MKGTSWKNRVASQLRFTDLLSAFMIPDDFDREAICRSISDGVYRAFADAINDSGLAHSAHRDAILDSVERGVHGAIMTIMDAAGGYPMTRGDILEMVKQGASDMELKFAGRIPDGQQLAVACPSCGESIPLGDEYALRGKDGDSVLSCSCGQEIALQVRQAP